MDAHSLSYLRFLIVISSIALFFIRFVLIYLVIKLGYLKMVDDDDDLTSYAPEIKDLRIEPEFSQSDIRFSNFY